MQKYILLIMTLAWLLPLSASIEVRSTHYTTSDGIANNTIRCMLQDSKGFLWLGTLNGLSRYDGNSFINYYPQEGIPSLMDHRIRRMQEDGYGLVWISVVSERLCCYDLKAGRFVDFTGCGEYAQPYQRVMRSSNGDIWMWHERYGCRRVRCNNGVFSSTTFRKENGNLSSNTVTHLAEDEKGSIWILTSDGVERVKGDKAEQVLRMPSPTALFSGQHAFFVSADGRVFKEEGGSLKEMAHIPGNPAATVTGSMLLQDDLYIFSSAGSYIYHSLTGNLTQTDSELNIVNGEVQKDNRENYWIYNNTGKVRYVNAQTRKVKSFHLLPENKIGYIDFERYRFVHDSRDIIWISTYGNGLFAYNLHTDKLQHFTTNMNGFSHIPSDYLLYVMEDHSGGIWVSGEFSGVSRLTVLNEGATYLYPEGRSEADDRSNFVRMLTRLDDGNIYAGTRRGGVYIYDKNMQLIETQKYHSNIYAVIKDTDGHLWTGSRGEGLCIDGTWYKHHDADSTSLANNHIFCMCRDRKGRIWIGTFNGGLDLAVKTPNGYVFRHFLNRTYNQRQIRALCEDRNGYIWAGTSDGIHVFQPDSLLKTPSAYWKYNGQNSNLHTNEVKSFCADSQGRMWIAASGVGLSVCHPGKDYSKLTFENYDTHNGLVNNMVQAIVEDRNGKIWIATEYGISCLDAEQRIFENYFFSSYVLSNTFSDNSVCVAEDGRIMFGSGYGLLTIRPGKTGYRSTAVAPTVTLTGLKINGMTVQPGEKDSPLAHAMAYTTELKLSYGQNSFGVDFSTFDYSKDGTVKYMNRLDGYDKTWSVSSSLNFAVYKNIPPGTYLLRIKACNALGIWGDHETTLRIVIAPPFWRSGWAYFAYVLLIIGMLWFLLRILKNFNTLRNRIEVERQLTEYKLVFFTNISHEFRTPLTLIQGALEKIEESAADPKVVAYSLKVLDKSTKRMLRLINQLLEFRKMQNNKLALSLEKTDVVAFLYEIFLSFKDSAESKKMNFRFVSSVESYHMFIDKGNLDKVSYNLLSNAFKYTPAGGKIIFAVTVDAENKRLVISVSDTGVGIPKEKRGELFKRFMQSNFSGNSIGVGLHLTHELVTVHRGTITYSENEGGGSVFTVCLPADAAAYEEKDFLVPNRLLVEEAEHHQKEVQVLASNSSLPVQPAPAAPLNKRKILIIEDDNDVREFLAGEIGRHFEVVTEADGVAGLEKAKSYDADLIVCDVLMPGMTGFEVTHRLKSNFNTSHIPVILLTALSTEDKQMEGVQSGADAYITKPFSPKLLMARISKLIEQRERLREKFSGDPSMVHPSFCASQQDKEFAERLQIIMDKQMGNAQFTIDEFAVLMKLGRTVFYRKVRGVTGYTPNEYMRIMRLKKAAELLAESGNTISEISYRVGINDPFYFSKCFKQQFGVTPSAYQKGERG